MHWVEKPGTSLEAMRRITERASKRAAGRSRRAQLRLAHRPRRGRRRGRRARTSPSCGSASIPTVDYEATVAKIQAVVDGYPGPVSRPADLPARAHQGGADRRERDASWCASTGPTSNGCGRRRRRCATRSRRSTGVADLKVEPQVLVPQIEVRFDPSGPRAFGLTAGRRAARRRRRWCRARKVGEFYEDQRLFDVVVWGTPEVARATSTPFARCRSPRRRRRHGAAERRGRRRRSRRRRTRSRARTARAASTSPATCAAATSARGARHRGAARGAVASRGLPPRGPRRVRRARRRQSTRLMLARRARAGRRSS